MKTVQKSAAEMKDEASKKIQETKEQLFSKKDEEAPDQGPAVIQAGPHIKTEEDITAFVKEQHQHVLNNELDKLMVPKEEPFLLEDDMLNKRLRLK